MAENKQKKVSVNFKLKEIEILEKSLSITDEQSIDSQKIDFTIKGEININKEENSFISIFTINIINQLNQKEIGRIKIKFIYIVTNFDEVIVTDEKNEVKIPNSLITLINSLSISTSRGIIFSELSTSKVQFILPIIPGSKFSQPQEK